MSLDAFEPLTSGNFFSDLDRKFADFVSSFGNEQMQNDVWLAAALASRQTRQGNICLDLGDYSHKQFVRDDRSGQILKASDAESWSQRLRSVQAIGEPGFFTPLILDGHLLYLNRYWNYERELIENIKKRLGLKLEVLDLEGLRKNLSRLFSLDKDSSGPDWQKVSAAAAVLNNFCIISGSPGTGKTTIVFKILVLLLEQTRDKQLRIALTAPTGKAANRLKESIKNWKAKTDTQSDALSSLPEEVFTLHRLLGSRSFSSNFRFNQDNPLPYDVVILDEASMVDLPLMVKLLRALPENSKLIILGDKNQLASVEAGAVFSDLCGARQESSFGANFSSQLEKISGEKLFLEDKKAPEGFLDDSIVILQKNFRFSEKSGINQVSRLVNNGEGKRALELMESGKYSDCTWQEAPVERRLGRWLVQRYKSHYKKLFTSQTPEEALSMFQELMILCALRQGPFGVESINLSIEKELEGIGLPVRPESGRGIRPIMITTNDYHLGLFNGDVGILFYDHTRQRPDAFFPDEEGRLRRISPARLPAHVNLFAMTVHKSQGSEFKSVHFILPNKAPELLSRELVYTAITRGREMVEISGGKDAFIEIVSRKGHRASGLLRAFHHA